MTEEMAYTYTTYTVSATLAPPLSVTQQAELERQIAHQVLLMKLAIEERLFGVFAGKTIDGTCTEAPAPQGLLK